MFSPISRALRSLWSSAFCMFKENMNGRHTFEFLDHVFRTIQYQPVPPDIMTKCSRSEQDLISSMAVFHSSLEVHHRNQYTPTDCVSSFLSHWPVYGATWMPLHCRGTGRKRVPFEEAVGKVLAKIELPESLEAERTGGSQEGHLLQGRKVSCIAVLSRFDR